jgi:hypothetical protein
MGGPDHDDKAARLGPPGSRSSRPKFSPARDTFSLGAGLGKVVKLRGNLVQPDDNDASTIVMESEARMNAQAYFR